MKNMQKLIIATGNAGKLNEFRQMLGDKFEVVGLKEAGITQTAEETGETFEQNAFIKAEEIHKKSGENVLADDSGLCVYALNGAPGVFSARYAGENASAEECNALLLKNMQKVTDRRAYFECCLAFIGKNGRRFCVFGKTEGEILAEPKGEGGFGYDSLFYSYDLKKSFGEATADEKNAVSHRSRALKAFVENFKK